MKVHLFRVFGLEFMIVPGVCMSGGNTPLPEKILWHGLFAYTPSRLFTFGLKTARGNTCRDGTL